MYYYHDLSGIATLKLDIEHTATCENNWYLLHIIGLGLRFGKFSFYIMKKFLLMIETKCSSGFFFLKN